MGSHKYAVTAEEPGREVEGRYGKSGIKSVRGNSDEDVDVFCCNSKEKNTIIPSSRSAGERQAERGGNEKTGEIKSSANTPDNTIFCLSDYLL